MTSSHKHDPLVSIIISNFNGAGFLRECLLSLAKSTYTKFEIIVVDAGSTDGSGKMVRDEFPCVKLIQADHVGIGTALNIGFKHAVGDVIVFDLNNDDVVDEQWLNKLVEALRKYNWAVLVCGKRYTYGTKRIDSIGGSINMITGSFGAIRNRNSNKSQVDQPFEVGYLPVYCASRDVIRHIGPCDEAYEIYFEDSDYGYMARLKGFRNLIIPQAEFYHHGSATVGKVSQRRIYFMARNRLRFILKNFPLPFIFTAVICSPIWLVSEFSGQYKLVHSSSDGSFDPLGKNISSIINAMKWNIINLRSTLESRKKR